jgi:hypothetical protein
MNAFDSHSSESQAETQNPQLSQPVLSEATFQQNFQNLMPLILSEWPQLSKEKLLDAKGDLEQAIATIASQTQHTRTLVRNQLSELAALAAEKSTTIRSSKTYAKVDELVHDLEARTEELIKDFKSEVLPELENRARSNLGTTLFMAVGLGFILGLLFGGRRG